MHSSNPQKIDILWTLLILAVAIAGWEIVVSAGHVPVYIMPSPSKVVLTLYQNAGRYAQDSLLTLGEALMGLLLGALTGIVVAVSLSFWPRLEQAVMTLAILIKSTPMVAIAPLLTIWLGFGILPKVIITALLAFFPVLVNALSGFQAADLALLETFHSWHANRREILWHVRVPQALPYMFAALKVSAPLALIGAVIAEWTGASGGLGRTMWLAYSNLNLPYLFAAVFILAVAGISIFTLLNWIEDKVVFWERRMN
jgi:NitT/TauT family transport system permease protein